MTAALSGPEEVVVGTDDLEDSSAFWQSLGFDVVAEQTIDAEEAHALYGLTAPSTVRTFSAGGPRGRIRLVTSSLSRPDRHPNRRGPLAVDVYSRDLNRSLAAVRETAGSLGDPVAFQAGPVEVRQVMVYAPDGLPVVLVDVPHRLPSLLDDESGRLHSEVHSVVWSVDGIDAVTTSWTAAGLALRNQFTVSIDAITTLMSLPRTAPISMSVLSGEDAAPARFELFEFAEDAGPTEPARPLRPGCFVPVFTLPASARQALLAPGSGFDLVADATHRSALTAPGRVEIEISWT